MGSLHLLGGPAVQLAGDAGTARRHRLPHRPRGEPPAPPQPFAGVLGPGGATVSGSPPSSPVAESTPASLSSFLRALRTTPHLRRSEERRVGKESRSRQ